MEDDGYFDKDSRSKRYTTTSFKKRDNKREQEERNNKIDRRLQQSLKDKYGDDYITMIENGEINGFGDKSKEEKKEDADFDWSEDEKKNGPKSRQNKNNSKKSKADKQKEHEDDLVSCAPKLKGRKNY